MVFVGCLQIPQVRAARQGIQVQGQLHDHALCEIAHAGHEQRTALEPRVRHDLGNVLVVQTECIQFKRGSCILLIRLDHLPAAPRITTHCGQSNRMICRQNARVDQGPDQRDGAGGVAARVGHAVRLADGGFLSGAQFRKSKNPASRHAVRGGSVDDARLLVSRHGLNQGDRFAGSIIVQAENHHIGLRHQQLLGGGVLA